MKSFYRLLLATILMILATPAWAQATRTWVSGVGDDVNPCSRTAPCKTFAGAISKTATGGEINVLDSAGYGAVTITKSITIDGSGAHASILAAGTNGIIVNGAGITVILRNLSINGANTTAGNGIRILNAAAVIVDNVVIENFAGTTPTTGRGVTIETGVADVRVLIQNSDLHNVFNFGIHSNPSAGNVILAVDNLRVSRGDFSAIQLRANTKATINRATLNHRRLGAAISTELTGVTAHVSNSVLSDNAYGVLNGNGGNPVVVLNNTVITGNTTDGIKINGGTVATYSDTAIWNNAGNESPSTTIAKR